MKLRTTPVITLTPEDRDIINRIDDFVTDFRQNVCDEMESCIGCPIHDSCYIMGQPENISYFLKDIEANAVDEEN